MTKQWGREEWQEHAVVLLMLRHGYQGFRRIPDGDRGDAGLEGYSTDGCAYQCYVPDPPHTVAAVRDKLTNKIDRDLKKFANNAAKLIPLLGSVKITRWILVTPKNPSKDVVAHAIKKEIEVATLGLPYIDPTNFKVFVHDLTDLNVERAKLVAAGDEKVEFPERAQEVPEAVVSDWAAKNDPLVLRLDGKISHIEPLESERRTLRDQFLSKHIETQNKLEHLKMFPDLWEALTLCQRRRKSFIRLQQQAGGASASPGAIMQSQIEQLTRDLAQAAATIASIDVEAMAWGTVAEWMLECSLKLGPSRA
jgi:hypothetical protein